MRNSCSRLWAAVSVATVATAVTTAAASAQHPESNVTPRGVLRISFEPWYINYNRMFDAGGNDFPLGTPLTKDSAGVNFFSSLLAPQTAIQSIIDDSSYVINAGSFKTVQEGNVRLFPFNFHFGLTDRITLTASLPVVTTRMQVEFTVDSTNSTMGWNQVAPNAANATARQDVISLLGELQASAAALDAAIQGGGYDCPSGPTCDAARGLLDRARRLELDLIALTGVLSDGTLTAELPPFNPVGTSNEGQAILAAIDAISNELQALGIAGLNTTLPLPEGRIGTDDAQAVLTDSIFGYSAAPLEFTKLTQRLGDAEIGLRWGLLQGPSTRVVLFGLVRLPTGVLDDPSNFTDLGTGDKQTDLQVGADATFETGLVGLSLSGYYNMQLGQQLIRRPANIAERPIAILAAQQTVSRKLGDEFRVAAYPAIRLHPSFSIYGSVDYYHKKLDDYSAVGTPPEGPGILPPEALELNSSMSRLSVGAGLYYRSTGRDGTSLPIEAGAYYFAAFKGEGGLTPQTSGMNFYLRLFWKIFGRGEAEPAEEETEGGAMQLR